jgi:hypothetical protein
MYASIAHLIGWRLLKLSEHHVLVLQSALDDLTGRIRFILKPNFKILADGTDVNAQINDCLMRGLWRTQE